MHFSILFMPPLMVFFAISSVFLTRQHLLMILLNLEVMILGIVFSVSLSSHYYSPFDFIMILVLLTLGACEASLGLACMVKMTRTYGNDNLSSLSIIKC